MTVKLPETLTDHPSLVGIIRFPCKTYCEFKEVTIPIIQNDGGTLYVEDPLVLLSIDVEKLTLWFTLLHVPLSF